jgi:nitroreductase
MRYELDFLCGKLNFSHDGLPHRHAFHDVGLAFSNLIFQATAVGLSVHQMAGLHVEKAREKLKFPTDYEPVGAIALGYSDIVETLPARLQCR